MAVFRALFVPVDCSEPSAEATRVAIDLAADQKARITFVNVVETGKLIASVMPGQGYADPVPALDAMRAAGADILKTSVNNAQAAGVKATSQLLDGDCVSCIIQGAAQADADLIVLGSHGRGGLTRLVLGSVAEGVVRNSTVPVLIAKAPK
ncbi:MAG TPA: universal stress protein [Candidatus Binatus sp.]|nr:universal stress protein [Candidatus Binatus sp.]